MKKYVSLGLILVMILSCAALAGCGSAPAKYDTQT